jgi:hypothetical protein
MKHGSLTNKMRKSFFSEEKNQKTFNTASLRRFQAMAGGLALAHT